MKKHLKILISILALLFGTFMFAYGEYDDSLDGQLFGLVAFIIGIAGLIKNRKSN